MAQKFEPLRIKRTALRTAAPATSQPATAWGYSKPDRSVTDWGVLMARRARYLLAAALVAFSSTAFAQSDAYKAGYSVGRQLGRFMGLALPGAAGAVGVVVALLVLRAWRKRRTAGDRRA
ncbi:hypothetical protein [Stenotrophomonas pictorum]|uniref:hypothetical protein n=1 Tax=Stenotrophomonas pictorum TaxID=86184 RepID=UPI0011AEBD35|nr:hypothetical protein [Stenotrophomonas pictorum]